MTQEDINLVIAARTKTPDAIRALLENRHFINVQLKALGHTDEPALVTTAAPAKKRAPGRPKGSKSRPKELAQIPPAIAEACQELNEDKLEPVVDTFEALKESLRVLREAEDAARPPAIAAIQRPQAYDDIFWDEQAQREAGHNGGAK